jgi:hypothetical protein
MLFFFFYKIREQEGRRDPALGSWYQWEGEDIRKGVGGYIWGNILYTCMKMEK